MAISIGTRLGSYEITALLGKGGMGEVYRARDRKLERDVAIKVLPAEFVNDPDRLARFEREARVLASLNHSSIGIIHDIQEDRGTRFLVLELVEGEALSARLKRGPLPVDEALELMKQVAEAIEAAHEKGIFHRDLKPANIQITPDSRAKVLDFGLAKISQPEATPSVGISDSPTLGAGQTVGGMLLGTAAYMSPEQARGRAVDKRTDIFAFGCVLYEALTGEPAFKGETVTDIIASVVRAEPDWSRLPAGLPSTARSLLHQCLQKQPKHRLHDIADARVALEYALTEPSLSEMKPTPKVPVWRWAVAAFVGFLLIGPLIGWLVTRTREKAPLVAHFEMNVRPANQLFGSNSPRPSRTAFAMSPDGRLVVFGGRPTKTPPAFQLYARGLDQSEATPIPGTEGGIGPFFSPDGQWIAFFARGQIKKVPIAGGPPVVICDAGDTVGLFGGSWAEDGTIFFSATGRGIWRVSSGGGTPEPVIASNPAKGERHLLPQPLPGGKALLLTVQIANQWDKSQVVLHSLQNGENRVLIEGGADARYVETGHLLYMRLGTLMAVPFDLRTLQVAGDPVALVDGVMQSVSMPNSGDETGAGQFTVSKSGALLYALGGVHPHGENSLVWVDRRGNEQKLPSLPVRAHLSPRLSPDGERLVVLVRDGPTRNEDVWVYDTQRGTQTRLTFSESNWPALWSPDGKRVVFSPNPSGVKNLYVRNADGSGQVERLTISEREQRPSSWAAQGNLIAFLEYTDDKSQIWVLPMDGDRKPKLFLESRFSLTYPEFSPDGRWMAYVSSESGRNELYVQPYPGPGEKYRISTEGASEPVWVGRELFYRDFERFFSVTITSLNPLRAEAPRLLFARGYRNDGPVRGWDASGDGQHFLLLKPEGSGVDPVNQFHVVLNWTEELKRRVRSK